MIDHQAKAEQLLEHTLKHVDDRDEIALNLQAAQVHATLALVERLQTIAEQGPGGGS